MADAGQPDQYQGWAWPYFVIGAGTTPDQVIPAGFFPGAGTEEPSFSPRHNDRGNVLFADGHVESFELGQMKVKNVRP